MAHNLFFDAFDNNWMKRMFKFIGKAADGPNRRVLVVFKFRIDKHAS